jgi:hypothetical protein
VGGAGLATQPPLDKPMLFIRCAVYSLPSLSLCWTHFQSEGSCCSACLLPPAFGTAIVMQDYADVSALLYTLRVVLGNAGLPTRPSVCCQCFLPFLLLNTRHTSKILCLLVALTLPRQSICGFFHDSVCSAFLLLVAGLC